LLFEGIAEGKGQLVLTFWKGSTPIGEGCGCWLDIKNIKKMYQRIDSATAHPWENVPFEPEPNEPNKDVVVFVHGWRMSPVSSGNFAESMYKRLWHRGFKGRFAAFHWDTWWYDAAGWVPFIGGGIDAYLAYYNDSERIAWQSAAALKTFVNSLPFENKNLVAHSMGNIVTGEALRQGMEVDNYALLHGAVPAASYDGGQHVKQTQQYNHLTFTMWDNETPDDDPDSATRAVAYRGRLENVSGNLINFFLPQDYATSFAWEVNNEQTKPPDGALMGNYQYQRAKAL
jgi:pimeloyl-ACP methyl ester carboxylesterase